MLKKWFHIILIFGFLLLVEKNSFSQTHYDFEQLNGIFEKPSKKSDYSYLTKNNTNELKWLASGLFLFYKSFFSSQDGNHCVFHPSCSVYAMETLKKNGILIGLPDAIDRLSRCNLLSAENYKKDTETNLLSDPVWKPKENE